MEISRIKEVIRKAKAILSTIKDEESRKGAAILVSEMAMIVDFIEQHNLPCPTELEDKIEAAVANIEQIYEKTATN